MASKRKRDIDDELLSTPTSKQMKVEDVSRSGRVRKKPAKFATDSEEEMDSVKTDIGKLTARGPQQSAPSVVQTLIQSAPISIQRPSAVEVPVPIKTEPVVVAPVVVKEELVDESKTGARAGRARKKSAKVLEMEEFEEAEKKQTKKEPAKKVASPGSPVFLNQKKSQKATVSPIQTPVTSKVLSTPVTSLKIKDIPIAVDTTHPLSQLSPQRKSPIAATISPKSPSAGSAVSMSPDGKGSVIKLLLSSPAQSANPAISASTISQLSPPAEKMPTPTKKKKSKEKAAAAVASQQASTSGKEPNQKIKQALQMAQQNIVFSQAVGTMPTIVKTEATPQEGLKMKITQLQKEADKASAVAAVTVKQEPAEDVPSKLTPKEPKVKKSKKAAVKDEGVFLPPPLPSPSVIHVGPMSMGLEIKSEPDAMIKKKKTKGRDKMGMDGGMMDEFKLEMPEIMDEDSNFMDMDDEDNLIIPEEEVETTTKQKAGKVPKKKSGKLKPGGKVGAAIQHNDVPISDADLVMDLGRMNSGKKKKKVGKEKEVPEEPEKNLSKKKRAPTAYMLWCSANRSRVVTDNPGIDFSSISKTLGEMWSSLSDKEKMVWKRKAKKAAGKGSTLITTGKAATQKMIPISQPTSVRHGGSVVPQRGVATAVTSVPSVVPEQILTKQQSKVVSVDEIGQPAKGFGTDPVDVAAHLKIVGESLSIIGMRLQEHRGLIAVQGSLSVLLDSMLCAVAPLMCLTSMLPETDGLSQKTHMNNLDNIAYIMPGL